MHAFIFQLILFRKWGDPDRFEPENMPTGVLKERSVVMSQVRKMPFFEELKGRMESYYLRPVRDRYGRTVRSQLTLENYLGILDQSIKLYEISNPPIFFEDGIILMAVRDLKKTAHRFWKNS